MHVSAKQKRDFTNGKVLKNMLLFALPIAIASILQIFFNSADVAIVGQFGGSQYQAAVGATTSTVHLIVNLFVGLSGGVNVAMAVAFGSKDEKRQHRVIHTAMATAFVSGIIALFLGIFLSRALLTAIDTPAEILDYSVLYMQIYFMGAPTMMIYNFGAALLRSVGETKKPLFYLFIAGILNLIINIVTVMFLHWHVIGVALGTVLSQAVSAVLVICDLCKNKYGVHYQFRKTRFYKKELRKILKMGIPMGLNGAFFSVSNLLIQSSINAYGGMAIAGNTVAVNIEAFADAFAAAVENAAVTFIGQNIGAGKPERVKRILGACLFACAFVQLVFSVLFVTVGKYLCMLFNPDPIVIEWAMKRMLVVGLTYAVTTPMRSFGAALKGMGYSMPPMLVTLCITCVARVFYVLFIYAKFPVKTIEQIYIIYPITWLLTGLCLAGVFYYVWTRERKTYALKQALALQNTATSETAAEDKAENTAENN